jgi:translin
VGRVSWPGNAVADSRPRRSITILDRLDDYAAAARERLERIHQDRETAYATSRKVVQSASATIKQVHRGEFDHARASLEETARLTAEMLDAVAASPEVGYGGFVADAAREYAEAAIVLALIAGHDLPGPQDLDLEPVFWLNGLADAAGELRRHVLDLIRRAEVDAAEDFLRAMDEIYQTVMSFDYPSGVTYGLRGRSDAVRGMVERTRGDLTNALRQARLEQRMKDLEARLPQ